MNDQNKIKLIEAALRARIEDFFEEENDAWDMSNIKWELESESDSVSTSFSIKARIAGAKTEEQKTWEKYAPEHDLDENLFGQIISRGKRKDPFRIIGWLPNRPKNPILTENTRSGKQYIMSVRHLKALINLNKDENLYGF